MRRRKLLVFRFLLLNLKMFGEIVTTNTILLLSANNSCLIAAPLAQRSHWKQHADHCCDQGSSSMDLFIDT